LYARSIARNFPRIAEAIDITPSTVSDPAFRQLARDLAARTQRRSVG
jgi:hypothetical protein